MGEDLSGFHQEKRNGEDRRKAPREETDRRELRFGIRLSYVGVLSDVQEWLEKNCDGRFSLVISGLSEDFAEKRLEIMFEHAIDRNLFKENVSRI